MVRLLGYRFNKNYTKYCRISIYVARLIIPTLICFIFVSCKNDSKYTDKPEITVSILPQKFLLEKIAGDKFKINVLVLSGSCIDTYDFSPKQISQISHSLAYLKIGNIEFEDIIVKKITENDKSIKIFNTSIGIQTIKSNCKDKIHLHNEMDPHVWTSTENLKIISNNIFRSLLKLDAQDSSYFANNFNILIKQLDSMDVFIKENIKGIKTKKFIIYHPVLSYYSQTYDFEQIPIEKDGKETSLSNLKDITKLAKETGISTIVIQKQYNTELVQTLAREINANIVKVDPLAFNIIEEIKTLTIHLKEGNNIIPDE